MTRYYIEEVQIKGLWGYRDVAISLNRDLNIIIGANGSGKTTILNLIYSILSSDFGSALNIEFEEVAIHLRSGMGKSVRTVKVRPDLQERVLNLSVGQKRTVIDIDPLFGSRLPAYRTGSELGEVRIRRQRASVRRRRAFRDLMPDLVSIFWLPVSRRLPELESEEEPYRRESVDWVDVRLSDLHKSLAEYYSRLNAQLAERYKAFEHQVLSAILYSKEQDQPDLFPSSMPTEAEREQLLRAFEDAGLLDEEMQRKINDHLSAAEKALRRFTEDPNAMEPRDILVLLLVGRTKLMVEYAGHLERDRERIFLPIRSFEKTVNSFLEPKRMTVDESGNVKVESPATSELATHLLSSGEKQILILLTQALMSGDDLVVYIADEPELSLHVDWQGRLLEALIRLGGGSQVIVATHSPDIVGRFQEKIIDLGREG